MERSKDWLDEAEGDLVHGRSDIENGFYNWACFSAQQSSEKAVIAVFQKMHAEAWGHSVADLLEELSKKHKIPDKLLQKALELDKAYIPARYPNAHPSGSPRRKYTREEAERLAGYAEEIFKFCKDLLPQIR